jgi:hypothetical protein
MYISINNQLISSQNCLVFYLIIARERLKRNFLISNVVAGNVTLCHGQHAICELLVERAWSTGFFKNITPVCGKGLPYDMECTLSILVSPHLLYIIYIYDSIFELKKFHSLQDYVMTFDYKLTRL